MSGPLSGLKVLELTSVVLGPWAAQTMADMGANVIKIEAPFGDSNRQLGASRNPGMAALYLSNNRNKRSLVLDLKQESARDALLAIVKDCDVFLHNNRPQVMTKLDWNTKISSLLMKILFIVELMDTVKMDLMEKKELWMILFRQLVGSLH